MCVCLSVCVRWHMCGGQRTACRSGFPPSTMWILKIEVSLSSLALCAIILPGLDRHFAIILAEQPREAAANT